MLTIRESFTLGRKSQTLRLKPAVTLIQADLPFISDVKLFCYLLLTSVQFHSVNCDSYSSTSEFGSGMEKNLLSWHLLHIPKTNIQRQVPSSTWCWLGIRRLLSHQFTALHNHPSFTNKRYWENPSLKTTNQHHDSRKTPSTPRESFEINRIRRQQSFQVSSAATEDFVRPKSLVTRSPIIKLEIVFRTDTTMMASEARDDRRERIKYGNCQYLGCGPTTGYSFFAFGKAIAEVLIQVRHG